MQQHSPIQSNNPQMVYMLKVQQKDIVKTPLQTYSRGTFLETISQKTFAQTPLRKVSIPRRKISREDSLQKLD